MIEKIEANDYNPNVVPTLELNLLYKSIKADGYTQPIVTYYDPERDKYVIVDGFHRYLVSKMYPEILEGNHRMLPIVVIKKDINDRMASTIRHNRARGRHVIDGMVGLVYHLLENGWDDARICDELGMQAEELVRIKYISGYAKLYENVEYSRNWVPAVKVKPKPTKADLEDPDRRLFRYAKENQDSNEENDTDPTLPG